MSDFIDITDKFKKFSQYDRIIEVLDSNDYYKVAITVEKALANITTSLPRVKQVQPKNPDISIFYRYMGNAVFTEKSCGEALQLYNLAIMHAPLGSRELIVAYSNRSALHCKIEKYSAALVDIERCIALKCRQVLRNKLEKRKEECQSMMWKEDIVHNNALGEFNDAKASEEFFKLSGKRNPKFPFAKNSVNVVLKHGKKTIVAQSDIKVGEIIAIEKAFIVSQTEQNKLLLCYYCSKSGDNMIPCKTCPEVLYCNEACRDQCWEDHHNIECPMMEIFNLIPNWCQIWLKFVFKTWNMNKDLQKFAEVSHTVDALLQGSSSPDKLEMDNVKTYLHPPAHDRIKRYGMLYDASIRASLIIHGLKAVPASCFGKEKKEDVIKHMIKQFMYHTMHSPVNAVSGATLELGEQDALVENFESIGYFPFLSCCKHDCNPNTLSIGLGNKLALVAIMPIKAGTELTIFDFIGRFGDNPYQERQYNLYNMYNILCECQACTEDWKDIDIVNCGELEKVRDQFQWMTDKTLKYELVCEIMSKFSNSPNGKDYTLMYTMFRQLLSIYQHGVTKRRFDGKAQRLRSSDLENICNFRFRFGNNV